jgi:hypothetical protein
MKGVHAMPRGSSAKRERLYEHVRDSAKSRGASTKRAKEIAARTVNKQRQSEGRTQQRTSSGTGNPNKPLEERTVQELRNRAGELGISGRSSMKKSELIRAIRSR